MRFWADLLKAWKLALDGHAPSAKEKLEVSMYPITRGSAVEPQGWPKRNGLEAP
jgi:hypothetical protein